MSEPEPQPRKRGDGLLILLAAMMVGASGLGALVYSHRESLARRGSIDGSGFDLARTEGEGRPTQGADPSQPSQAEQPQSGLSMITGAVPGMRVGANAGAAAQNPRQAAARNFTQSCRASEGSVRALAEDYTRRYPVIQQYGREWMSYPDLKKLNDDYMRDHDPVKFLSGLAASPNFPKLVKKYATSPEIQGFAKDIMARAPGQLMSAGIDLLQQEGSIKSIAENIVQALGLPPGILDAASSGKIDQNAVMSSIMSSNPQLQKALDSQGN